jgi:sortase A
MRRRRRRSERRIFTRRRRRTGLGLFISLVVVIIAGVVVLGLDRTQQDLRSSVPQKAQHSGTAKHPEVKRAADASYTSKQKQPAGKKEQTSAQKSSGTKQASDPKSGEQRKKAHQAKKQPHKERASSPARKKQASAGRSSACGPRVPTPPNDALYLTVPKLGIYGDTVTNSYSEAVMNQGAIKLPPTGFPWQPCANTYIIGHRLGYSGTESYYQFYNLPSMKPGDEIILSDSNGTKYIYRVTRVFAVGPYDTRYTYPVPGENLVTLQTCITSLNDWWSIGPAMYSDSPDLARLLVQGERVAVQPGS